MNYLDDEFRNQLKALISTAFQNGLPPAKALEIVKDTIVETMGETSVLDKETSNIPAIQN